MSDSSILKDRHERAGATPDPVPTPAVDAMPEPVSRSAPGPAAGAIPGSTPGLTPRSTPDPALSIAPERPGRRRFLQSAAAGAALTGAPVATRAQQALPASADAPSVPVVVTPPVVSARPVQLMINGRRYDLQLEPRVTLLDALRDYAGLTGSKKGCDRGQCGACTVLVNGRRINACLTLAVMHEGDTITTVEGLGMPGQGPGQAGIVQQSFVEYDAFQCGFCTPGQLCSATAVLTEFRNGDASAATADPRARPAVLTDAEIRERMSGNICRCGAYQNIVGAIRACARAARVPTDPTEQPVVPGLARRMPSQA